MASDSQLGTQLREARLAKRATLDEAAAATRIRRSYLEALEADDYESLPAQVYVVGFLKNYARYLGLPPEDVVARYHEQEEARTRLRLAPVRAVGTRRLASSNLARSLVVSLGIIIVLVAVMNYLYQQYLSAGPSGLEIPPAKAVPAANKSLIELPPLVTPTSTPLPSPTPTPTVTAGLEVRLKAVEYTWIRVMVDEVRAFEGFLGPNVPGGDAQTWRAQRSVAVRVGRADGLEVTVNGKRVGTLGREANPVDFRVVRRDGDTLEVTINDRPVSLEGR